MDYRKIPYEKLKRFCEAVFCAYGFDEAESRNITDILLSADLAGIESHGVQRLMRYHREIREFNYVNMKAVPETVKETPVSATIDGHDYMGQILAYDAMTLAIKKAKETGIGMVTVRNGNHAGIMQYYTNMAVREGLMGIAMVNTESIMVPTFGSEGMLGTNPIAFAMPASPTPFSFDAATTVVPRGKLEVYVKREKPVPEGWVLDENGKDTSDAALVLKNIIDKTGGGILPIGGSGEDTSGYKGFGFAMICEIMTAVLSCGFTSNMVNRVDGRCASCQFMMAIDHGIFGDRKEIEAHLSTLLQQIRDSKKAEGQSRIYIAGEKEYEARERIRTEGINVNEKTYAEMKLIAEATKTLDLLPAFS